MPVNPELPEPLSEGERHHVQAIVELACLCHCSATREREHIESIAAALFAVLPSDRAFNFTATLVELELGCPKTRELFDRLNQRLDKAMQHAVADEGADEADI